VAASYREVLFQACGWKILAIQFITQAVMFMRSFLLTFNKLALFLAQLTFS
jgi:hypothetical protein